MFQKSTIFNDGIANLRAIGEIDFAEYLIQVRGNWLSDFLELRNRQEHHGWTLDGVKYALVSGTSVAVNFPTVLNLPVEQFAQHIPNRIILFIENTMVYAFQRLSKGKPINIVEIPNEFRDPSNPQRFRLTPKGLDPSLPWKITYKDEVDFT